MQLGQILARTVFGYAFLLILLRLSGHRMISQATSFDLVFVIILGDLFDDLFFAEVPVSQFVIAAGTLLLMEIIVSLGALASETFARWVDFPSRTIIRDGTPVPSAMRDEQLNQSELETLVRAHGGFGRDQWREISAARLESEGRISVLRRAWAKAAQKSERRRLRK